MESAPHSIQDPPINAAQIDRWETVKVQQTKERAAVLPVITEVCISNGLGLVTLNVRPDLVSRRQMADEPNIRVCPICKKSS
jgi:hypothetical protein